MSDAPGGRVVAVAALGMGACCALPVILGSGLVGSLAGVGLGSGLLALVGLLVGGAVGFGWWRRRRCSTPSRAGGVGGGSRASEEERHRAQPR